MSKKTKWFARGGEVTRLGPFGSQLEATRALRLRTDDSVPRYHDNAFVWPEEVEEKPQ